ncbi:unnamed protein product [Amaranthus hypochondriacus]
MASSTSNQPEKDEGLTWEDILNAMNYYEICDQLGSSSSNEREIDQEMGRHIAGNLVDIPKLNSLVYYFPQGHIEHVQEGVLHPVRYGSFLCRVANVSFHADPQTDQVFVKFLLEPWITNGYPNPNPNPSPNPSPIQMGGNDNNDIVSFVKVLSNTDVSHVARHLLVTDVFRKCIFSQFPKSIKVNQYILVNDIHGTSWKIMFHSLGFPTYCTRLTHGWYDFVKIKNLIAGDSIIFMLKKSTNEYFVGIRRTVLNKPISVKDVEDAIEKVRNMKSFEVVYYPNLGLPEFVVPKEKVDDALHVHWRRKMSVKIAYEDFRCTTPVKRWFYGYILKEVNLKKDWFWPKSSWRMLQVQWNVRPDILKNMPNMQMNMSPWEVEVLQPSHEELALSNNSL